MKSIGLIGFGVSNQSVYNFFRDTHKITVHNPNEISLPKDVNSVFGSEYLKCDEDIIFRSPSVKKRQILTHSPVFCETIYALNKLKSTKICVTGSDGKTTTCSLIYNVLKDKNAFLGGNIGNPIINALDKKHDFVIGEISSFQLLDEEVFCDTAIITNITPNHLNYHTDMEEYIGAKENLIKNTKKIVLNRDDKILFEIGEKYRKQNRKVEYFSLKKECDAYTKDGYVILKGEKLFSLDKIKLKGDFNILNVLATVLATYEYATFKEIENGICSFCGVKNRLEFVRNFEGVAFYNSSIDSTPSRTVATLSSFDIKNCVVILGGSDKNLSYDILGEHLKDARYLIILGENKRKIIDALSPYTTRIIAVNTLFEAISTGFKYCQKGDNLILSPASCSFDMYENYTQRGNDFIKIVKELK